MRLDSITTEMLNNISNEAAFDTEQLAAIRRLHHKIEKCHDARRLSQPEVRGMAVGIHVGLILAEAWQLEKMVEYGPSQKT